MAGAGQLGWQLREPFGMATAGLDDVAEQHHSLRQMHMLGELARRCPCVAAAGNFVEGSMKLGASFHPGYVRWRRRRHLRGPARRDSAPGGLGALQPGRIWQSKSPESMAEARADASRRTAVCTQQSLFGVGYPG